MKEFEDRLLTERRKILKEMGHLESTVLKVNQRESAGDLSGYSFHMADVGTDAMEREKAFQLASAEGRTVRVSNRSRHTLNECQFPGGFSKERVGSLAPGETVEAERRAAGPDASFTCTTSAPRTAPSSMNCTPTTPTLSAAVAETGMEPETEAPEAGAVIETVGGVVSGGGVPPVTAKLHSDAVPASL